MQGQDPRAVELLAMAAYYHRGGTLGLGQTLPIGEPWLPGFRRLAPAHPDRRRGRALLAASRKHYRPFGK